jgi:hypothetical protein
MMERVREEKDLFERGLARYRAAQCVHAADERSCSTTSASRRCAPTRAHLRSIEDSPFTKRVCAAQ